VRGGEGRKIEVGNVRGKLESGWGARGEEDGRGMVARKGEERV